MIATAKEIFVILYFLFFFYLLSGLLSDFSTFLQKLETEVRQKKCQKEEEESKYKHKIHTTKDKRFQRQEKLKWLQDYICAS